MTANRFRDKSAFLFFIGAILLGEWVFPKAAHSETLYVKRSGTRMHAAASARAPVVRTLEIGAAVDVLKKSRIFYQVSLPEGGTGWVYKFKLTRNAPVDPDFDPGIWGVLGGGPVITAKEADSGSMIRGLKPLLDEPERAGGADDASIQAVEAMETPKVTPQEVDAFLSARGLGEYRQDASGGP